MNEVSADKAELSERIPREVMDIICADPFAQFLGMEVVRVEPGKAIVQMRLQRHMANAHGTPHGGILFSLADAALALACNSHGIQAVALDVSITFCRPAPFDTVLTAVASEENRTRSTALYEIRVMDEAGKLIASAKGTAFRTGRPLVAHA